MGSDQEWLVYDVGGTTSNFGNLSLVIDNWADSNGALFDNLFSGSSFGFRQAGSDVYLDYTFGSIIPEPSRVVLLALGVLGVFFRRRRAV